MALIRTGGGVAEIRGSIGGTTFSRNRGGAIARNRTKPINPNTLSQAANRTRFSEVVVAWSQLADKGDVDSWNTFAQGVELVNRLGEAYTPSGRQVYLMTNLARLQAGLAITQVLPADTNVPAPPIMLTEITAVATSGTLSELETNVLSASPNTRILIDATPPLPPSVTNVENKYRRIANITPTAAAADLLAGYELAFPLYAADPPNLIYWRARQTTTTNPFLSPYVYGASPVGTT